ncbi:hypothetical protein [Halobacterium zhouii]|uniref:hypothetical protein n=1 Tax=Halobacterium zhouii TaxID=2902624 RepID=UPI001E6120FC|nr:hypothetical protein [Halobacterium zhouii]
MAQAHWDDLRGRELRYRGDTWELTGDLDIRRTGEVLAVAAKQVDESAQEKATLYFGVGSQSNSLNPGSSDANFDHFEWDGDRQVLVVDAPGRRYRYELDRIEYT